MRNQYSICKHDKQTKFHTGSVAAQDKNAALPSVVRRDDIVKLANDGHRHSNNYAIAHHNLFIGTWNVRTLKDMGKIEVLASEISTIDWNILGIAVYVHLDANKLLHKHSLASDSSALLPHPLCLTQMVGT